MARILRLQIESDVNMNNLTEFGATTCEGQSNSEWSSKDQSALEELTIRRAEYMARRSDELLKPFKEVFGGLNFSRLFPDAESSIRYKALDIIKALMPEVRKFRGHPTRGFLFVLNLKWTGDPSSVAVQPSFPVIDIPSWDVSGIRAALATYEVAHKDGIAVDDNLAMVNLDDRPSATHLVVVRLYD